MQRSLGGAFAEAGHQAVSFAILVHPRRAAGMRKALLESYRAGLP